MDRILNPRIEKQTIYELYRACRLCGAGAGYKMPIIQNVVDFEGSEVELKQKIRECVQVEVNQDDKMPPLICELCVDKVNDFYEFLELCRQTNKRTRMRLGLPIQSSKGSSSTDSGDCILGMTEPVYINDDSDGEPLAKHKTKGSRPGKKKVPEVRIKMEVHQMHRDTRSAGNRPSGHKRVSPPRVTRTSRSSGHNDDVSLSRLQTQRLSKSTPKSILKRESDFKVKKENDTMSHSSRLKRMREKDTTKSEVPVKRVKIAIKNTIAAPKPSSKPARQSRQARSRPPRPPPPPPASTHSCPICKQANKTPQGNANHMRSHIVTFTSHKLACNACRLWFPSSDEAATHHRRHRNKGIPYHCARCNIDFRQQNTFDEHFSKNQCVPSEEVPDIKCDVCWRYYATNKLYEEHKCGGEEVRPGGKCNKCNRNYALLKNLKKHVTTCAAKKKGEGNIDPALLAHLKPLQVRVARCDPLLANVKHEHVDVSTVLHEYGLDKNCVYPYISFGSFRIKSEFSFNQYNGMVNIEERIKEEFCSESFVHWDSEDESDSESEISSVGVVKPIDSLSTLTLKTIFSQKFLGKVPRKRRRVKTEKFDMSTDLYVDINKSIDTIIDNLGDDDEMVGEENVGTSKGDLSINYDDVLNSDIEKADKDASKNDASVVSFDDLLSNDERVGTTTDNQDVENTSKTIEKDDEKDKEANDTSKDDVGAFSFDDLLQNDDHVSKTKEHEDDVKETEANATSKSEASVDSFDDVLKSDVSEVKNTYENQDGERKISGDVEMTEVDTKKINDDKMDTDDNTSNVELSKLDGEKCESSAEVNNGEENSRRTDVAVCNDISIEQSKVISVNDSEIKAEDISIESKDEKQNATVSVTDDFENAKTLTNAAEDVSKVDDSKNNTSIDNTHNEVINDVNVKDTAVDFNTPSNITKETVIDNVKNEATDVINEKSACVQTKDSKNCSNIVNGEKNPKSDELHNLDDISDTEMDDKKLMEALDAQIGENNDTNTSINDQCQNRKNEADINETGNNESEVKNDSNRSETRIDDMCELNNDDEKLNKDIHENNESSEPKTKYETVCNNSEVQINALKNVSDVKFSDKIILDDLISTKQNADLKSLDLDSISDEDFNFDV